MVLSRRALASASVVRSASICICSAAVLSTVMRMVLAWKNDQRSLEVTFKVMAEVCALLPSVSENARNSASTEISSAIFLLECAACSACSACSRFSCALIAPPEMNSAVTMIAKRAGAQGVTEYGLRRLCYARGWGRAPRRGGGGGGGRGGGGGGGAGVGGGRGAPRRRAIASCTMRGLSGP